MTTIIIVAIYTLGVFAARAINERLNNIKKSYTPLWGIWLLSWISFIAFICVLLVELSSLHGKNWFTGKYWKDEK